MRARTISVKRMTKRELEIGKLLYPETDYYKPKQRAECAEGPRPCPYVSCKHHLFIDVSPRTGAIKLNFPDLEVWEIGESCALDVADRGGTTLEDVGAIMNLTRERIRQVEVKALAKLEALRDMSFLRDFVDEGPVGKRRLPQLSKADMVGTKYDDDETEDDELERSKKKKPSSRRSTAASWQCSRSELRPLRREVWPMLDLRSRSGSASSRGMPRKRARISEIAAAQWIVETQKS